MNTAQLSKPNSASIKVGFTGAGSTGKTTLVDACGTDHTFNDYKFYGSITRAAFKSMGYDGELDQYTKTPQENFDLQSRIFEMKINQQNDILNSDDNIISDRILLDHFAYTMIRNTEFITNEYFKKLQEYVELNIDLYDLIVYFEPLDKFTPDDFRDDSIVYPYLTDYVIRNVLFDDDTLKDKIIIIKKEESVDERLQKIKNAINNLNEVK